MANAIPAWIVTPVCTSGRAVEASAGSGGPARLNAGPAPYHHPMNDAERLAALLNIVDDTRTESRDQSEKLVILGLAERRRRGFWPTQAGWNLMGDQGRDFN